MIHKKKQLINLCFSGMIAAIYTVLTVLLGSISFGPLQCRVSEVLCVLPVLTGAAIPGLTLGCFLSALLCGAVWQDFVFGTLATFLGALGAYLLGNPKGVFARFPHLQRIGGFLAPIPTIFFNTLIIPFVLAYGYGAEEGMLFLIAGVGVGELLSAGVLGTVFYLALRGRETMLRGGTEKQREQKP